MKMTILYVIGGVGGKFLSMPFHPHAKNKNHIQLHHVKDNHKETFSENLNRLLQVITQQT